eukprot:TRINITY_DN19424_c0_g1_i1.p1 TRINITY_DN19424_c0_g1~~TRINITY_DN19424_c0_g1_i1.p1  ORF type:complete len:222 (+),score=42.32 TRINITY_DN19424_c0_g1_i1:38-667(+)
MMSNHTKPGNQMEICPESGSVDYVTDILCAAAPLATCAEVLAAGLSQGDGPYMVNPSLNTSSPSPAFVTVVNCIMDTSIDGGGWTQVLNVHTSDGNVVNYENTNFWTHNTSLGGARSELFRGLKSDYKHPYMYANYRPNQLMIKVHSDGQMMYWRSWALAQTISLRDYFSTPAQFSAVNYRLTQGVRQSGGTLSGAAFTYDPIVQGVGA